MKKNKLLSLLCIVLFVILGGLLWREHQVDLERSEYYKQLAKEDRQKQLEEEKKICISYIRFKCGYRDRIAGYRCF